MALLAQVVDGGGNLAGLVQGFLREEHFLPDVERGKIGADQFQHHPDGPGPHDGQPFGLGQRLQRMAMLARQRFADGLQVSSGIEAGRDFADGLAQRLAVAEIGGAGEDIDLRAGIVDVILPGDLVARLDEKLGQRIAEHRAPHMADMERAGGIGGDILHIRLLAAAQGGAAIGLAKSEDAIQHPGPYGGLEPEIDEAGAGDLDGLDLRMGPEPGRDQLRQRPRRLAEGLVEHHRGIGGDIAMGRIARRLRRDAGKVGRAGNTLLRRDGRHSLPDGLQELGKQVHIDKQTTELTPRLAP